MSNLPCAQACERNKDPILALLRGHFARVQRVLEIGSGTGQHAVHFAPALPHLQWQASERATAIEGVRGWLEASPAPNLLPPLVLDVHDPWPAGPWDAVFSANTLHIMDWSGVQAFFRGVGSILEAAGLLVVYGPFNYHGDYTSASNREFDAWLKQRDPASGLRDIDDVHALATAQRLACIADHPMPANNRLLVWRCG